MATYDYYEVVCDDIREWIFDKYTDDQLVEQLISKDDFEEWLNDELLFTDQITGNCSGSYTYSAWQAEENLCHNWGLLREACDSLGNLSELDPETADVTIRCYILPDCITQVLEGLEYEYKEKITATLEESLEE